MVIKPQGRTLADASSIFKPNLGTTLKVGFEE